MERVSTLAPKVACQFHWLTKLTLGIHPFPAANKTDLQFASHARNSPDPGHPSHAHCRSRLLGRTCRTVKALGTAARDPILEIRFVRGRHSGVLSGVPLDVLGA